jgi:hypothetical protein
MAHWGVSVTAEDAATVQDAAGFTRLIARALAHRQPRYAAMARQGVTVTAEEVAMVRTPADFDAMIAKAIDRAG